MDPEGCFYVLVLKCRRRKPRRRCWQIHCIFDFQTPSKLVFDLSLGLPNFGEIYNKSRCFAAPS